MPDLAQGDLGHDLLEAGALLGGGGAHADVGVDDHDILGMPAEADGPLLEGILQPQALLMGEGLVRASTGGHR